MSAQKTPRLLTICLHNVPNRFLQTLSSDQACNEALTTPISYCSMRHAKINQLQSVIWIKWVILFPSNQHRSLKEHTLDNDTTERNLVVFCGEIFMVS